MLIYIMVIKLMFLFKMFFFLLELDFLLFRGILGNGWCFVIGSGGDCIVK